ncbi:MAG: hypothetical protein GX558_12770, partial [Clostridiales bacterium]|nr:hypothetical protein [Clostridiales bacterium]
MIALRGLACEVAELASRPDQIEKSILWQRHNDLRTPQPLIFCDPENGWHEIIPSGRLQTRGELARAWEFGLLRRLDHARFLKDDMVIDDAFWVPLVSGDTGWGVEIRHTSVQAGGAYRVQPAIEDYERDFDKLRFPQPTVDWPASDWLLGEAHRVFDGILRVERYAQWWWSLGLTCHYIDLRGMENFLCDLTLEPEWVHRMMSFLCEGALKRLDDLEKDGLLFQNTGNHYVGSGGFGFTGQLAPAPAGSVTPMDMWGFVESQETSVISPEMYGEFVFPYHLRLAERFGLNCFGCCEPYEGRWAYAKRLPRLRRVSCSPWSDR